MRTLTIARDFMKMKRLGSIFVVNILIFCAALLVVFVFSKESIAVKNYWYWQGWICIQSVINLILSLINMFLDVDKGKKYFLSSVLVLLIGVLISKFVEKW